MDYFTAINDFLGFTEKFFFTRFSKKIFGLSEEFGYKPTYSPFSKISYIPYSYRSYPS